MRASTLLLLVLVACGGGSPGADGHDGRSCTTTQDDAGRVTVTCDDGFTATSPDLRGEPGAPGKSGNPGSPGVDALATLTPVPPGPDCADGGVRLDSGYDRDGDGVLDPEEGYVHTLLCSTEATCATLPGSLVLETELDLRAFELAGCHTIGGGLRIGSDVWRLEADMHALRTLRTVSGSVEIAGVAGSLAGLEHLQSIGGDLRIHDADLRTLAGLDGLTYVGRDVVLGCGTSLEDVTTLHSLQHLGGDLWVADPAWGVLAAGIPDFHGTVRFEDCP